MTKYITATGKTNSRQSSQPMLYYPRGIQTDEVNLGGFNRANLYEHNLNGNGLPYRNYQFSKDRFKGFKRWKKS